MVTFAKVPEWMYVTFRKKPMVIATWCALWARHPDWGLLDTAVVEATQSDLAEDLNCSTRAIREAQKLLEATGAITQSGRSKWLLNPAEPEGWDRLEPERCFRSNRSAASGSADPSICFPEKSEGPTHQAVTARQILIRDAIGGRIWKQERPDLQRSVAKRSLQKGYTDEQIRNAVARMKTKSSSNIGFHNVEKYLDGEAVNQKPTSFEIKEGPFFGS